MAGLARRASVYDFSHGQVLRLFDDAVASPPENLLVRRSMLIDSQTDIERRYSVHVRQDRYLELNLFAFRARHPQVMELASRPEELLRRVICLNLVTLHILILVFTLTSQSQMVKDSSS